jgi:hypothetical protein
MRKFESLSDALLSVCCDDDVCATTKRRRRVAPNVQMNVANVLASLLRPVVLEHRVVCPRIASLSREERGAVWRSLVPLVDLCARVELSRLLDAVQAADGDEAALLQALRVAPSGAVCPSDAGAPAADDVADLEAWLSSAPPAVLDSVAPSAASADHDEHDDDARHSGSQPLATQFVRENLFELNKTLAQDELRERLQPVRKLLSAGAKSGQVDWTPLLREVESGADVHVIVGELDAQLRLCSVETLAALLSAFCNEKLFSFSLASKSGFFEVLLGPRLCAMDRVAPRVLVAALQLAMTTQHARACVASLLVPMLATGGAVQCELVGRILKETAESDACNELLERFNFAAATTSEFTFGALQGVLDKKSFRLSGDAATAICHGIVKLAPQHSGSLKFASLLFRLVSKHTGDIQKHRSELLAAAELCSGNFMGKQAAKCLSEQKR